MIIKIGEKRYNTETMNEPFMVVFRQDELWNLLMSMMQNPALSRFAVLPPKWTKEQKDEFMQSEPTPETPQATKDAIKVLQNEFLKRLETVRKQGIDVTLLSALDKGD